MTDSRDLESLSSWHGEGGTLKNGDFSYKCNCFLEKGNFYSVFRAPISVVS